MIICEKGFDAQNTVSLGNKLLTGNGYLGYRGTLDEFSAQQCVGLNVASFYDGVPNKWRETVNAFNPFYLVAKANGCELDVRRGYLKHTVELHLENALFVRETVFDVGGVCVTLRSSRFVSLADKNLLCSRVEIVSDADLQLQISAGVDKDVWDLNGPHLVEKKESFLGDASCVSAISQEKGIPVCVSCRFSVLPQNTIGSIGNFVVSLQADKPFVLDRVAHVLCGEEKAVPTSYQAAWENHCVAWKKTWNCCGVSLLGNSRADLALQYSIYHLIILAPKGDYSIAARGLSGQTYKGAVFWDTEIYLLPFYLNTMPDVAKKLVRYRVDTLPQAMEKAQSYGFGGAFYAWESQDGFDACSDFNVVDAFTHRPVRTYFKDKQIHISADVAYAVLQYFSYTHDVDFMLDGGLQAVLQCAEFARTYSYFNHVKARYELLDVIGPDEYHERVNNNAFTNYMFYFTTCDGVKLAKKLKKLYPERYQAIEHLLPDVAKLEAWAKKLYLPQPNQNGVIEQFDGYFSLEDVSVDTVRLRLVKPNEYWGGSTGVATATRVIKQADVITLFNLYPQRFSAEVQKANYDFYLPYTEHGSSLSQCSYALTACRIGQANAAYDAFLSSAEIDLLGGGKQWAGDVYIGGTHPAASGGAWQAAVLGFAGMKNVGGRLSFSPSLPSSVEGLRLSVVANGKVCKTEINKNRTVTRKYEI